jgi:hypothetical protein
MVKVYLLTNNKSVERGYSHRSFLLSFFCVHLPNFNDSKDFFFCSWSFYHFGFITLEGVIPASLSPSINSRKYVSGNTQDSGIVFGRDLTVSKFVSNKLTQIKPFPFQLAKNKV